MTMIVDGNTTIRFSETKLIAFDYKAPLGSVITILSATVTLYDSNGTVVFANRSASNIIYLTPSTGRVLLGINPSSNGLNIGDDYTATCSASLTATSPLGTYSTPDRECVALFTVLSDWGG